MFNLIISIIAIALVVALAGASLYYGGDAFSEGSTKAKAAAFINQAQQIQAAATLYKANSGGLPADIAALEGQYMASLPVPPANVDNGSGVSAWAIDGNVLGAFGTVGTNVSTDITPELCEKISAQGSSLVMCYDKGAETTIAGAFNAGAAYVAGPTVTDVVIGMSL